MLSVKRIEGDEIREVGIEVFVEGGAGLEGGEVEGGISDGGLADRRRGSPLNP